MDFASYQARALGLSLEYQSLARWFLQSGGSDFHSYVSSFFPHLSADASRDFSSGSSLFLSALRSLAAHPSSALPSSCPPVPSLQSVLLHSSLPSALASAALPPHIFPSTFPPPSSSAPFPPAPLPGVSAASVRSPPGFASGLSGPPPAPVFLSLPSADPPAQIPAFSVSSLSVRPSAPVLGNLHGVAAAVVPAAAPALFRPFAVSVTSEAPIVSSAPAVFASDLVIPPSAVPSGLPPLFPHARAPSASFAQSSLGAFHAAPDDPFDLGYPDAVPRDPKAPVPLSVPDLYRTEMCRMLLYIIDLFRRLRDPLPLLLRRVLFLRTSLVWRLLLRNQSI